MSVNFLDASKWVDCFDANITAQEGMYLNSYIPIPDILVGTSSADYLAISVESINARPQWRLGLFLQLYVLTSFAEAVEFYRTAIPLRIPKVIEVPKIQPQYSIRLSVPTWHQDIIVDVKEYLNVIV
jgi:hypothetical protein